MPDETSAWPDDWAQLYDSMDLERTPHIGFYSSLVDGSSTSLLDLGCGTGSVTLEVAAKMAPGARIVGVDLSPRMIEIARARAPQHDWRLGDLTRPPVEGRFDLVMVCFHTLQMLLDPADFQRAMQSAARHLAPGGRFAFDIYQPNPDWLARVSPDPVAVRRFSDSAGNSFDVFEAGTVYSPDTQVLYTDWTLREAETGRHVPMPPMTLRVRQYFPGEVQAMIASAGMRIESVWGDFDRRPFGPDSIRQIYVCRPA